MHPSLLFLFAAHLLVAHIVASDSGDSPDIQGEESGNTEVAQRNKRVSELLDDKDLRELLIQRLQNGGHMAAGSKLPRSSHGIFSPFY